MTLIRAAVILALAAGLPAVPAAAQAPMPRGAELRTLHGLVFAAADDGANSSSPRSLLGISAARRALAPFGAPFSVGGQVVVLERTGLTDLAAVWGPADRHGQGEVEYSVACWASMPAGLQVAFSSALDVAPPYHVNGWSVAQEPATPAGCQPAGKLIPRPPALPGGLVFGQTQDNVARAVKLRPTTRRANMLEWFYVLPAPEVGKDTSRTVVLHATFVAGHLAAVSFSALLTD